MGAAEGLGENCGLVFHIRAGELVKALGADEFCCSALHNCFYLIKGKNNKLLYKGKHYQPKIKKKGLILIYGALSFRKNYEKTDTTVCHLGDEVI